MILSPVFGFDANFSHCMQKSQFSQIVMGLLHIFHLSHVAIIKAGERTMFTQNIIKYICMIFFIVDL
jgi:hypothetical protein